MTGFSSGTNSAYIIGTVFTDTLWQGLIIGLSLLIGIFFLKKGDARSRYNLASIAMLTMLLWTCYDLIRLFHTGMQVVSVQKGINQVSSGEINVLSNNNYILVSGLAYSFVSGLFRSFYLFLGRYYSLIVPVWIGGISLLTLRLAGGWLGTLRLRNRSVFPLSTNWHNCMDYLITRLNIGKKVLLKGSYKITSPMVIGYLRPIILIPAAIISSLSYSEMEAILAHELAHIRRHDFLFICIQNVAEILLFYHPVTWMISSFLNKEREKCCDDVAVSINNDSIPFAKAITLMEDLHAQNNMPAVFFLGRSNNLLVRMKRILHNGMKKSNITERIAASVIIMSGLCIIFAFAGYAHNKPAETTHAAMVKSSEVTNTNLQVSWPDTLKKFKETRTVEAEIADDSSKSTTSYKVTYENDSVKDFYINRKKISRDQLAEFKNKLTEIKKFEREKSFQRNFHLQDSKMHAKELLDMAMQQSKLSMEKAFLDMQINQEEWLKMANSEELKMKLDKELMELQNLREDKMMQDLTKNPADSNSWINNNLPNPLVPKLDEKQVREMKQQMQDLQKRVHEAMKQFNQEFQKSHGKMLDSLKREMEKMHKNITLFQGNDFFDWQPYFNFPDFRVDNSFLMPGPGPGFWKQEWPDTSAMEDKLRKLEK